MIIMNKYMKMEFNSDDYLPLKKTLELYNMIIIDRSIFLEGSKCYLEVFLDECCRNYKWRMIGLKCLKELLHEVYSLSILVLS